VARLKSDWLLADVSKNEKPLKATAFKGFTILVVTLSGFKPETF
jgi:hypothetical protein